MMKHISKLCSYLMMVSLVASGLAALALLVRDNPPPWMAPLAENATQVIISALAVAFAAASFASLQATSDFVRALRAGKEHRLALVVSAAYALCCIVIEVVVGKAGLLALNVEIPDAYLIAGCTFFALAPRMRALIDVTMAAIDREEAKVDDKDEKAHELARLQIIEASRNQAIANGVKNLEAERAARKRTTASVGLIGAAAILAGGGGGAEAQQTQFPIETVASTAIVAPSEGEECDAERAFPRGVWAKNASKYDRAKDLFAQQPNISAKRVARIVGISKETAKNWRIRAQAELAIAANPANALLLDGAT